MIPAEIAVDVVKAVGMTFAVVIEEFVHLRTAAGMNRIVSAYVVSNHRKHGALKVGAVRIRM